MQDTQLEIIQNLKRMAIRRCEERIADAEKGSGIKKELPQFGVTSMMKYRHGLSQVVFMEQDASLLELVKKKELELKEKESKAKR